MPRSTTRHAQTQRILILAIVLGLLIILLSGCYPSTYSIQPQLTSPSPLPPTQIYFYPAHGQSEPQQQRDRYECYLWAVKHSGFDPNQAQLAPHQRVEVKARPSPGTGTAVGAVSGAIIGAIISPRRHSGEGLVFGAITGALLGTASDIARQQEADRIQQQYNAEDAHDYARLDRQARDYRRAMSACLEGRGYTVQ